ncbi:DUF4834 family protein [Zhouia sp. PK063]|uniref:DUF4834 family protein n=1 Tax=Zhouia sp. PK063 TaxID=3373602 RepID=UPI0037B18252
MPLLKTILIILLLYFAFKILWKLFAPSIFSYLAKRVEDKFAKGFGQPYQNQNTSAYQEQYEGEVTIDKQPVKDKKISSNKKVGEYIDFEELD